MQDFTGISYSSFLNEPARITGTQPPAYRSELDPERLVKSNGDNLRGIH